MEPVELLSNLQNLGYEILSKIQNDYKQKRLSKMFDQTNDIAYYQKEKFDWGKQIFDALLEIFPTSLEANKFKNAPKVNITYAEGENAAFGSIKNRFQDQIAVLDSIISDLNKKIVLNQESHQDYSKIIGSVEIKESISRFQSDYPEPNKVGFIIMRFGNTKLHEQILQAIRDTLNKHGLVALRADDKEYHDDLYYNSMTYLFGCGFGIAVYEQIETTEFNPNVSLEVGGMLVLGKPVCLLKDKTLNYLNTDLIGKLYSSFDPENPTKNIADQLSKWLSDKGLV